MATTRDRWAEWLLHRRHGGDAESLRRTLEFLGPVRDRVIENGRISDGDVVLDVGAGDGLIGLAALERVGAKGRVIFDEISADLLAVLREQAQATGVIDRCQFVQASADELAPITDASVDVVTTRSVLIYVSRKADALREFHRVLRPGGRISLFEPVNRFSQPRPGEGYGGYDIRPIEELYERVQAVYRKAAGSPMLDFDERTLLELADAAGFRDIRLDYHAEIGPPREPVSWDRMMRSSPNPLAPTGAEAIAQALSAEEAERYVAYMRPLVDGGAGRHRSAHLYLTAVK